MRAFLETSRVMSLISLANENKNKNKLHILISLLYIYIYIWSKLKSCLGACKVAELKIRSFFKILTGINSAVVQRSLTVLIFFFISVVLRNYEVKKNHLIKRKHIR